MGKSTTERGLGWTHQKQRDRLLRTHRDGTLCWWCNHPMYRTPAKNWDGKPLEADHSQARSNGGTQADRLLCSTCNRQRQDGRNDHLRPAITGTWPPSPTAVATNPSDPHGLPTGTHSLI